MAAISDDLPAFGKPTRPISATVLSSRVSSRSSPGSPLSAKPGALRRGDASAALPRPPRPPAAATKRVPVPTRSARTSPSGVRTTVPFGTLILRSCPAAPCRLEPSPCLPLPALPVLGAGAAGNAGRRRVLRPPWGIPPAPGPAVAAVRPAERLELPPGAGGAAVPAVAGVHPQHGVVSELRHDRSPYSYLPG